MIMNERETFEFEYGKVEIIRAGQMLPYTSDDVVVLGKLSLKAEPCGEVLQILQFGHRLTLCNMSVHAQWGKLSEDGLFRYIEHTIYGRKWSVLFNEMRTYMINEVKKIDEVLAKRAQVLRDADKD